MTSKTTNHNVEYFTNAIFEAENIIRKLKSSGIDAKINSIALFTELPKLPRDEESRQLKIYKEASETYKKLYIEVARAIMHVIDSSYAGFHDKAESYNYSPEQAPIAAVEAIKSLPNAFIGGPIKTAVASANPVVQKIAIEYFETLPSDIRISEVFPKDFNHQIKKLKPIVEKKLTDMNSRK